MRKGMRILAGFVAATVALVGALALAPASALASSGAGPTTDIYRLYNPNAASGAHHYTTDAGERDALKAAGWKDEGTGWTAITGRQFLLDESAPKYVREAAAVLEVPNDEHVTYAVDTIESEYNEEIDGRKTITFYGDDNVESATAYLNEDNTVDLSIFHTIFVANPI